MKSKISILVMLLIFLGPLSFQSCEEEPVAFKEYGAFTIPELVAPSNGAYLTPTGTTVDLKWSSTDAEGDPQKWDVYFGASEEPGKVASGHSSQTYSATVDIGTKYFWRVVGYDANGIPTRSDVWSFEIVNPAAPMLMKMEWTTNAADAIGLDLDPTNAVNLRLLIRKADMTAYKSVNTTGFEEFKFDSSVPDGKYLIATNVFSTVDAGDFNAPLDISIDLSFSQRGIQNQKLLFPNVMSNKFVCSTYTVYLATIEKTGDTYELASDVIYPSSPYSGVWYGLDADYDSEVETYMGCSLEMKGLIVGWLLDFWGEPIVKGGTLAISIDETTGAVTIPDQYYCQTTYNGALQTPYNIVGSGTFDASGTYPTMKLKYSLIQDGWDVGQWCYDEGYWPTPYFEADLTLDPGGKGSKGFSIDRTSMKPLVKPVK